LSNKTKVILFIGLKFFQVLKVAQLLAFCCLHVFPTDNLKKKLLWSCSDASEDGCSHDGRKPVADTVFPVTSYLERLTVASNAYNQQTQTGSSKQETGRQSITYAIRSNALSCRINICKESTARAPSAAIFDFRLSVVVFYLGHYNSPKRHYNSSIRLF
jgi:hypothetical protein